MACFSIRDPSGRHFSRLRYSWVGVILRYDQSFWVSNVLLFLFNDYINKCHASSDSTCYRLPKASLSVIEGVTSNGTLGIALHCNMQVPGALKHDHSAGETALRTLFFTRSNSSWLDCWGYFSRLKRKTPIMCPLSDPLSSRPITSASWILWFCRRLVPGGLPSWWQKNIIILSGGGGFSNSWAISLSVMIPPITLVP